MSLFLIFLSLQIKQRDTFKDRHLSLAGVVSFSLISQLEKYDIANLFKETASAVDLWINYL